VAKGAKDARASGSRISLIGSVSREKLVSKDERAVIEINVESTSRRSGRDRRSTRRHGATRKGIVAGEEAAGRFAGEILGGFSGV